MPFAVTGLDPEFVILSKVSQAEKDKYHMRPLICGTQNNSTNELIHKTETESQTQKTNVMFTKGKEEGEINWEAGIDIYTLPSIKQITKENITTAQHRELTQCSVVT